MNASFGDNFALISPVNDSRPGKYLLRRAEDASVYPGLQKGEAISKSRYQGIVNFPTIFGTILIRILLKHNTTANLNRLRLYQSDYSLESIRRASHQSRSSQSLTVTEVLSNGTAVISTPDQILNLLAKIAPYN